jgi:cytochrome c heme-lyase
MPEMSQEPADGQTIKLSKQREVSGIPKAGEAGSDGETNWVYPSPQQFYHAMRRRNKDPEADAMDAVVHVHNVTNEKTWDLILNWESLHKEACPTPSLLRFVGRSEELSNKAQFKSRLTHLGRPFDRHDWYVDRCGLKTVRYVIDYYDDQRAKDDLQITIDCRPAMDSFGAAWDRLRNPFANFFGQWEQGASLAGIIAARSIARK